MAAFHKLPQLMNGINHHDLAREWIHAWNTHNLEIMKHRTNCADGTLQSR